MFRGECFKLRVGNKAVWPLGKVAVMFSALVTSEQTQVYRLGNPSLQGRTKIAAHFLAIVVTRILLCVLECWYCVTNWMAPLPP